MNNTYVFNYTPLASNPDEFYDKFVITNPNLNHLYIRELLDKVKAKNKTVTPKWNMYQNSVGKITAFSFMQNAGWISKEYFSGNIPKLIVQKISNFDKNNLASYRVSFQQQILKFFRKMSFEEKLNYDAVANAGNPSGYNVKLHREEQLIIDRFICGESIPKISMDYTTTYKVIHKILIKAGIFYKTINARKIQRKQDIIDIKIRKKENKILLEKSKHEKQIKYKILNREIRENVKSKKDVITHK